MGLASLEVGLLDDARRQFARVTQLVPAEPAAWANLGLTELRLGELDNAIEPVNRAVLLAPDNSDVALLAGRVETTRGRLDDGIAHLRRAVALDPESLRARFALAEELERSGVPGADDEAQHLIDEIVQRAPNNLAALLEGARLAAKRGDAARLQDTVGRLEPHTASWPAVTMEQYGGLQSASVSQNFTDSARATALLRNVLARVPAFLESLAAVRTPAELIAEPFDRFVVLETPLSTPSPPDMGLAFDVEPIDGAPGAADVLAVFAPNGETPALFQADAVTVRRIDGPGAWPFPANRDRLANSLLPVDWNNDFRTDLVATGPDGIRLLLQQEDGQFEDATAGASVAAGAVECECIGAWAADVEMDGDIDLVVAVEDGPPFVLRNAGDGTWRVVDDMFPDLSRARGFAWADLDQDADPDAVFLDAAGRLHVFINRQAGDFLSIPVPEQARDLVAITAGDVNADGMIDVVALDAVGAIRRFSLRAGLTSTQRIGAAADALWEDEDLATWSDFQDRSGRVAESAAAPGRHRLFMADLDNNGALDLVASGPAGTQIWLADATYRFQPLPVSLDVEVFAVLDMDGNGRLDLVGLDEGRPVHLFGRGELDYHWKSIRPRAQTAAGDQRINSFGIGGAIQVRSGLLTQTQVLAGAPVHFGLGTRTAIDVARIVWPNGVAQAEFDVGVDDTIVAEQRLKGSCPWVFAYDGDVMQFVTDFLWRSPLGLRINAQETAGATQTEDWVKIRGDQLAARDGFYDVRITAELWETHFVDHVSLMVVDRPADIEVFVDERFSAAQPPRLAVQAVRGLRPVGRALDHEGRDVTDLVAHRDGQYLARFELGQYQGIAHEHFVEVDLGEDVPRTGPLVLLANGWIYPTDSSINLAVGQGERVTPAGIGLEAQDRSGQWRVVDADLGFPAGKNKTIIVDLSRTGDARRVRLRTNLEIAWDWLAFGELVEAPLRTRRLPASSADLRFRGFSRTISPRGESPETPIYDQLANTAQRWRDLIGYYTRFGDVRELLEQVDDRYVIMNAGDELRLRFEEQPDPPAGWARDFVLIGDGWVKDGDYNTSFSQTVLPLPSHHDTEYGTGRQVWDLEDDPVYQRYPDDWERYHTRYVTPGSFVNGLWREGPE